MIRAVIFDFDGTILDTEWPTFLAWQDTYAAHGQTLTFEEYAAVIGTDFQTFDPRRTLEERCGRPLDWEKLDSERRSDCHAAIAAQSPLPGICRLVQEAQELSIRCAVASSSPSDWVIPHLERLGLRQGFQFISCAENGCPPKPEPDVYLRALEALAVSPQEALAIEDSPNGVIATQRAGIRCVIVPNQLTSRLSFPNGLQMVRSLDSVYLKDYLK